MKTQTTKLLSLLAKEQTKAQVEEAASAAGKLTVLALIQHADSPAVAPLRAWAAAADVNLSIYHTILEPQALRTLIERQNATWLLCNNLAQIKKLELSDVVVGTIKQLRGSVFPATQIGLPANLLMLDTLVSAEGYNKYVVVPTYKAELQVYLAKVTNPNALQAPSYEWAYLDSDIQVSALSSAAFIAIDIETSLENTITSIAFCPVDRYGKIGMPYVATPSAASFALARQILSNPIPKCFHNGTFDNTFLMWHSMPCHNYLLDTEYMWHAWECEREKSLAYLSSIALPWHRYWKEEHLTDLYGYNAKDAYNTAACCLWLLEHMPQWARWNYSKHVPKFVPTVICNMEGLAVDKDWLIAVTQQAKAMETQMLQRLVTISGDPNFNPGSPQQLSTLLYDVYGKVLGIDKPTTQKGKKKKESGKPSLATDEMSLSALALTHPLFDYIIKCILQWREASKAISTYYTAHLFENRLYYSFNLDGTVTDRFSCAASTLRLVTGRGKNGQVRKADIANYGTQIQNAPPYFKAAIMADPGYVLVEFDKSKSEAFCVSHISQDPAFTAALHAPKDFYLHLAELFFGIVTDDMKHPVRQLCKKINHATSYCMGWQTFLDNVGLLQLQYFAKLVEWQWDNRKDPRRFIEHLLNDLFHNNFSGIKRWWKRTTEELIAQSGHLQTPDKVTRHFYRYPSNASGIHPPAVAHQPQHLSVAALNRAMCAVFWELVLPSAGRVRLKGQVHDSLLMMIREGPMLEQDIATILEIMDRPYRTKLGSLAIPTTVSTPATYWKGN